MLRSKGSGWSQLTNGFGLILFREEGSLSDAEKSALNEWKSQPVTPPAGLVALSVGMTEPLREQALGLVSIGKMSVSQALASQGSQMGASLTPAAMGEVVGLYFDLIETFLKGLQDTTIGLDLSSEALMVENVLTAKPGTDLANWVQKRPTRSPRRT